MFAWTAFLEAEKDTPNMDSIHDLRKDVILKKRKLCTASFPKALERSKHLKNRFDKFIRECEEKSDLCKYFSVFQDMFTVIKNLVVADRDGDWNLHVGAVQAAMPIFQSFDAINYLRYSSFYLEKIQVIKESYPTLYE